MSIVVERAAAVEPSLPIRRGALVGLGSLDECSLDGLEEFIIHNSPLGKIWASGVGWELASNLARSPAPATAQKRMHQGYHKAGCDGCDKYDESRAHSCTLTRPLSILLLLP